MMTTTVDPRVKRTKRSFEEALLSLLEDYDFEKITVRQISEKAGLNRATFYLHYFDKEDLLEQYLTRYLDEFKSLTKIMHSEFSYDTNYAHPLFIRMFEHMQENHKFYKIMLSDLGNSQILYSIKQIIESMISEAGNHMRQDGTQYFVPSDIRNIYITSAYLGTILWWLENDMPYPPKEMATQLTTMSTIGPFKENPFI